MGAFPLIRFLSSVVPLTRTRFTCQLGEFPCSMKVKPIYIAIAYSFYIIALRLSSVKLWVGTLYTMPRLHGRIFSFEQIRNSIQITKLKLESDKSKHGHVQALRSTLSVISLCINELSGWVFRCLLRVLHVVCLTLWGFGCTPRMWSGL